MLDPKRPRVDHWHDSPCAWIDTNALAVIQLIVSGWSKSYRGGQSAGVRNQVAEAEPLPFPQEAIREPAFLIHSTQHAFGLEEVGSTFWPDRLPSLPYQVKPLTEEVSIGGFSFRFQDHGLHVDYAWSDGEGMPKRRPRPDLLVLEMGQWGQIRLNARHSHFFTSLGWDSSEWWYEKWVLNVGLFSDWKPRVFFETLPDKTVSMMAPLR